MLKKLKQRIPLLVILVLLGWGLWYSRPVGVETLFPDLEPELIDVFLIDESEDRRLRSDAGTEEFDALWEELQGLQFRWSPFTPVKQALPFLDGVVRRAKQFEQDDIKDLLFALVQDNGQEVWRSEQLRFRIDAWTYEDWAHDVTLSLWMQDSKAVGQKLAHQLWEQAEN